MSEKTKEQIKEELKKAVAEIKKIQQGDRSPKLRKIIREIVQDGDKKVAKTINEVEQNI